MHKKLIIVFWSVLIFALTATSAFAGSYPEDIIGLSSTEVILGTIEKIEYVNSQSKKTTIKVSEYLFETLHDDVVVLDDLMYSYEEGGLANPEVGDYCAVAIEIEDGKIKLFYNLAAKSDSINKSTLKLKSTQQFVEIMNYYINDGTYSKKHREEMLSVMNKNNLPTSKPPATLNSSIFIVIVIICGTAAIIVFIKKSFLKH